MNAWPVKPWNAEPAPDAIFAPAGMLGDEERRALYWLGRNAFKGRGAVVDAGAFLGASAVCLGAGVIASGRAFRLRPTIYSYDYFSAIDGYVADFISKNFRNIGQNESYLDIFSDQTRDYKRIIAARPGDFLNHRWRQGAVELLFIDIAKTRELNSHILSQFFPQLIPGESIVIQQDFYHLWHPYIHISMEYLDEYFDIVDEYVAHQSRIYRYARRIPPNVLEKVVNYDFTPAERRDLLRKAAERSSSPVREMLEAILIYQCALDQDVDAFQDELAGFGRRHPDFRSSGELWAVELVRIECESESILRGG